MSIQYLLPGIDLISIPEIPDPTCGLVQEVSAAQIQQLVTSAVPKEPFGWFWVSDVSPPTFTDPNLKRFVWIDTRSTPPLFRLFNPTLSSWDPFQFPPGTLSGVALIDGTVSLAKLVPPGAINARKVITANQAGTGYELIGTVDNIQPNSLPLGKINVPSGTPAGSFVSVLSSNTLGFTTLTGNDLLTIIADHSILLKKIAQSGATNGQVPSWNGTDWVPINLAATGPILPTPVTGDENKLVNVKTDLTYGLINPTTILGDLGSFKARKSIMFPCPDKIGIEPIWVHGLGDWPTTAKCWASIKEGKSQSGYAPGDRIDIETVRSSVEAKSLFALVADQETISLVTSNEINSGGKIIGVPGGTEDNFIPSNWEIFFYAQTSNITATSEVRPPVHPS